MWAYGVTLAMFTYTLMGLWMDRPCLWVPMIVTAAVLIGYFALKDTYWIWCSITNGGPLLWGAFILNRRSK
tara:strand:+ start:113 stop:325 length:213 start_codon:yes stop_codon:yes gene_type:complete